MTEPASLCDTIAAFLRSREVGNATLATLRTYSFNLDRFRRSTDIQGLAEATPVVVEAHLMELRGRMQPISLHQPFRVLRTFFRWCVRTGRIADDPMAGMIMRLPKTLPRVPDSQDVRRLLAACPDTAAGVRNRAVIYLAAGSGLRKEELRRLRVRDLDFTSLMVRVCSGKGQKDGLTDFGEAAASELRAWLSEHPDPRPSAFLFCTVEGIQLGPSALTQILHRLSRRAGLDRLIGPHALRHYAATELLRRSGNLELVRQTLRHSTLAMTLGYAALARADISAKFQAASPMDHLWGGKPRQGNGGRR